MKIAISTESTCDLNTDLLKKYNINVIPYSIIMGDNVIEDSPDVPAQIFKHVADTKKLPKTSAINEMQYSEHFSNLLKNNDAVVHITLSSGLTSSVANCNKAADNFKNVYVIDSLSLSSGVGLLALYASELALTNITVQELVNNVNKRIPYLQASFVIDKLDYLYKGGRCNSLALFGANLLKIHPQIVVKNGIMKPAKKYRGKMERVVADYCADTLTEFNNPDKTRAFITYTTATPQMIEAATRCLQNAGFKQIYTTTAGGTITSHCGENVLGILYINDGI